MCWSPVFPEELGETPGDLIPSTSSSLVGDAGGEYRAKGNGRAGHDRCEFSHFPQCGTGFVFIFIFAGIAQDVMSSNATFGLTQLH